MHVYACKYQVKCLKKLCQFKHSQATAMEIQNCEQCDYIGDSKENLETHICECHATKESVQDEENFELNITFLRFMKGLSLAKDRFIVTSASVSQNVNVNDKHPRRSKRQSKNLSFTNS